MIFIIMVNGNGRPPACKMQEARTGNYIPIWSGLRASLVIVPEKTQYWFVTNYSTVQPRLL